MTGEEVLTRQFVSALFENRGRVCFGIFRRAFNSRELILCFGANACPNGDTCNAPIPLEPDVIYMVDSAGFTNVHTCNDQTDADLFVSYTVPPRTAMDVIMVRANGISPFDRASLYAAESCAAFQPCDGFVGSITNEGIMVLDNTARVTAQTFILVLDHDQNRSPVQLLGTYR